MGCKERRLNRHDGVCLEALVANDPFYRQLETAVDWSCVRERVQDRYCWRNGRPSLDPVVFFKRQLILFFEGFRSERPLVEPVQVKLAFRWYSGSDLPEAVPSASNLSRPRDRYGLEGFRRFFEQLVALGSEAGLVWGAEPPFDASRSAANASYDKQVPRFYWQAIGRQVQPGFQQPDPIATGFVPKYPAHPPPDPYGGDRRKRDYWVNPVDPDATPADDRQLGDRLQDGVDGGRARIILGCLVTPQATQDNAPLLALAWWLRFRWRGAFKRAVADAR